MVQISVLELYIITEAFSSLLVRLSNSRNITVPQIKARIHSSTSFPLIIL
jgi:hypothetical protein